MIEKFEHEEARVKQAFKAAVDGALKQQAEDLMVLARNRSRVDSATPVFLLEGTAQLPEVDM